MFRRGIKEEGECLISYRLSFAMKKVADFSSESPVNVYHTTVHHSSMLPVCGDTICLILCLNSEEIAIKNAT
jgi:hypothetical protein